MPDLDACPHCGASLIGPPIPQEAQDAYGGKTHFRHEIGVEIPGVYDGILYWVCPDCRKAWQRWQPSHRLFDMAQRHIRVANGEQVDLLDPILAYLAEHPFTGEPAMSPLATFHLDGKTRLITVVGEIPDLLDIGVHLLGPTSYLDHGMFSFTDGVLTLDVEPKPLHYRPLRVHNFQQSIQFERIEELAP